MEGISIGRDYSGSTSGDTQPVVSPASSFDPGVGPSLALGRRLRTDFDEFFAPLYPFLTGHSWLVDEA